MGNHSRFRFAAYRAQRFASLKRLSVVSTKGYVSPVLILVAPRMLSTASIHSLSAMFPSPEVSMVLKRTLNSPMKFNLNIDSSNSSYVISISCQTAGLRCCASSASLRRGWTASSCFFSPSCSLGPARPFPRRGQLEF